MKGYCIYIVKFVFSFFLFFSCNEENKGNRTTLSYKDDSVFKTFNRRVNFFKKKNEDVKAIKELNKMLSYSFEKKDSFMQAISYQKLGLFYKRLNKLDSSYLYYIKSLDLFKGLNDSLRIGYRYLNLAMIESEKSLYYRSDSTAIKSLKYLLPYKPNSLSSVYNCLGINAYEEGEYNESLEWYEKAINSTKDSTKIIRYYNNKCNNYLVLKEYDKAISYYKKILNSTYYDSIPVSLRLKLADNYTYGKFLANQNVSDKEFLKTLKFKNKTNDIGGILTSYRYLTCFYKKNNKKKALLYSRKMYDLSKLTQKMRYRVLALDHLIKLEDNSKIKRLSIERAKLSDSLNTLKHKSQIKFLKIRYNYENERKQKLFIRAKLAEKTLSFEQQKSQKLIWSLVSLLLLMTFIIFAFYKAHQLQKDRIFQIYKTETRLSKKIHDELASDVFLTMSYVKKNKLEDGLLNKLNIIYTKMRDISYESSYVVTGKDFYAFYKQLFTGFSTDKNKIIIKGISKIDFDKLSKERQIVLYRVTQELLINMKKHSRASLIVISFYSKGDHVFVKYKDNGIGAKKTVFESGLRNVITRIKSVNGKITFSTEEGKGFLVDFKI